MSVAAFFRDPRVQSALAGGKSAQAEGMVREFLGQFRLEDCTAVQLLALADLATQAGDASIAREALRRALEQPAQRHLAHYKLGRIELAEHGLAAAESAFRAGAELDPEFAHNWAGLARALQLQGRVEEAIEAAERFAGFGVRPHAKDSLRMLADLADVLYDRNERARSLPLYDLVLRFNAERPRDITRLGEAHIARGELDAAIRLLKPHAERQQLDPWGRRALAQALSQTGAHDEAVAVSESAAREDPANKGFLNTYLDALVRGGNPAQWRDALARNADLLGDAGTTEIEARLAIAEADLPRAAAILARQSCPPRSRLYHLSIETAYAALGAGQAEPAQALSAHVIQAAPDDRYAKLLRIDTCFRQQLWEEAGRVLATMTDEERQLPHVRLKRFEHACFVRDFALADELRREIEAADMPTRQFMLPVFRFLAERKDWQAVVDRALAWLDPSLQYGQIGYVLYRAAKHTGRQAEMIAAIEAIEAWEAHPDLSQLRAILLLDRAETLPALERLAADPSLATQAVLRHKLTAKYEILSRALARGGSRAIFLCSDRNYLCATFVALHTIRQQIDTRGTEFFIVTDDDIQDAATRFAAPFIDAGLALRIVPAAEIVGTPERLDPRYGLFTSGHMLASSAYYRIFFAKYLGQRGTHERALYLDSDVLVRGRLEPLFIQDLAGQPISARLEPMRAEVKRAIALHDLKDNRYFNSGVLLFDLRHDQMQTALDRAIAAIMDDATTLLFHDQCALNLGFREGFRNLDPIWNYAVTEQTELADIAPNAAILHFLERPKPWSAAYTGEAAILWFDQWRETARFLGEALAIELFAMIED